MNSDILMITMAVNVVLVLTTMNSHDCLCVCMLHRWVIDEVAYYRQERLLVGANAHQLFTNWPNRMIHADSIWPGATGTSGVLLYTPDERNRVGMWLGHCLDETCNDHNNDNKLWKCERVWRLKLKS
jgi:hypothetical protein